MRNQNSLNKCLKINNITKQKNILSQTTFYIKNNATDANENIRYIYLFRIQIYSNMDTGCMQ
ncbi:hypothetical protein DERP_001836 [Dermatophagoides pteronyssinus]|uniref:Uncharacterized protein n=1 Tax=Dermatophagoides pteronyssinus TaxID=6956 RepID=A0ABQ8JC62_DERPT|nr:hypothetical protein DERP_001836 [Dermatophagoides pteronyssinus]